MIIVIPDDARGHLMASNLEPELRELGELKVFESLADTEGLLQERLVGAEVAITLSASPFTARVMSNCPALRHIAVFGIGVDNVDLETCGKLGITVTNTPAYSAYVVAEKALALALAVAHRVPQLDRAVKSGGWPQEEVGQLHGKTLGVVGTGPIGQRVAELGKALGMEVIAWTFDPSPQRAREYGVTFMPLDELMASADVISIQLPLTSRSRDLLGPRQLGLMKSSAILVNVGRGAVVDQDALVDSLEKGGIGGAGLDVFSTEPLDVDHPLRHLENVVLSPHIAANTPEANRTGLAIAIQNIRDWQRGEPRHVLV